MVPLIDSTTAVISDELNHNSIINAVCLSRPLSKYVYPHLDMATLDRQLAAGRNVRIRRVGTSAPAPASSTLQRTSTKVSDLSEGVR